MRELAQLERLLRSTPDDSPERVRIVLRLADTFAELARVAEIERLEAGEKARAAARHVEARHKPVATKKADESIRPKKDGD